MIGSATLPWCQRNAKVYICDFISVRILLKLSLAMLYELLEFFSECDSAWRLGTMGIFDIQQNLQFNIYIENTRQKALLTIVDSIAADHGFLIAVTRGIWSYLFAVKQTSNTGSDHIPIQWKRYQMYIHQVSSIFFIFQGIWEQKTHQGAHTITTSSWLMTLLIRR